MLYRRLIASALMMLLMVGCASRGSVKELRADVASIRMEAQEARRVAEEARRAADEANARSKTTEEMVNRGFKRSMYK